VQVTQEFDERLEILQALDVGYLTTFAHGNPSPAKAVDSAVEPTSLNSGRKFRAEQAWGFNLFRKFFGRFVVHFYYFRRIDSNDGRNGSRRIAGTNVT
jgi:hypothetical protein